MLHINKIYLLFEILAQNHWHYPITHPNLKQI